MQGGRSVICFEERREVDLNTGIHDQAAGRACVQVSGALYVEFAGAVHR
jgi:hypothetical protein